MAPREEVNGLKPAHLRAAASAVRFVVHESKFCYSRALASALVHAALSNPSLTCIPVLPAAPEEVAFQRRAKFDMRYDEFLQARCDRKMRETFGSRLVVGAPARAVRGGAHADKGDRSTVCAAPPICIHAKMPAFGARLCTVSAASLNGRSFRRDTEAGTGSEDPAVVRAFRIRCFDHWLPEDAPPEGLATATATATAMAAAAGALARLAAHNAAVPPVRRRGFAMLCEIGPGAWFGQGLPGVSGERVWTGRAPSGASSSATSSP